MPIYAYRCESCGHQQDVLQKMSAEPLTVCTACGASTFKKQVTAAGFQLKGSGWYVTDFRDNGSSKAPTAATAPVVAGADGASAPAAPAAAPAPAAGTSTSSSTSSAGGSSGTSGTAPSSS